MGAVCGVVGVASVDGARRLDADVDWRELTVVSSRMSNLKAGATSLVKVGAGAGAGVGQADTARAHTHTAPVSMGFRPTHTESDGTERK